MKKRFYEKETTKATLIEDKNEEITVASNMTSIVLPF